MDSDTCSVSASSSSSSPLVSVAAAVEADRLLKIEIEAAEVLADMAKVVVGGNGGDSCGSWRKKGKRARKRVKDESMVVDSVVMCSKPYEDQPVLDQTQYESTHKNVMIKPVKVEQGAELPKPSPSCSKNYSSFGGGRSRQNLTEAEKEAQRLRRVLANRESARQTIRRRQALCEDLTIRASDLALENEKLKKEKELALKEYQTLESTNKSLKEQIAKPIKVEVEETPGELKSVHVETPTPTSTNRPQLLYHRPPFTPLFWSAAIQSPNSVQSQHGHQNSIAISSNAFMPATCEPETFNKVENLLHTNGSKPPSYMLPCPLFFLQPSLHNNKPDEHSKNNQHGACSSLKSVAHVEDHFRFLPTRVKTEVSGSAESKPTNDLHEIPIRFLPDGGGRHLRSNSKERDIKPATVSSLGPSFAVKHQDKFCSDYKINIGTVSSTPSQIASSLPEKKQEQAIHPAKKISDTVAAAEARKRRKELTKLKNLYGRQHRMHSLAFKP